MPLNIKTSNLNGVAALKKLGLNHAMCDGLLDAGIVVKLTAKAFSLTKSDGSGGVDIPVTLDQLQALNLGTLLMSDKLLLATKLVDAIASLGGATAEGESPMSGLPKKGGVNVSFNTDDLADTLTLMAGATGGASAKEMLIAKLKAAQQSGVKQVQVPPMKGPLNPPIGMIAKGGGEAHPEPSSKGWATFPKSKLQTAEPVKLRDANKMYQPVYGTSSGSRYFMVAASEDIRIAARLDGGTLSVRVSGPGWIKHKNEIVEVGFSNVNAAKDYASLHMHVGDDMKLASKTLGAILTGLGVPLETPIPDLKFIYG